MEQEVIWESDSAFACDADVQHIVLNETALWNKVGMILVLGIILSDHIVILDTSSCHVHIRSNSYFKRNEPQHNANFILMSSVIKAGCTWHWLVIAEISLAAFGVQGRFQRPCVYSSFDTKNRRQAGSYVPLHLHATCRRRHDLSPIWTGLVVHGEMALMKR